MVRRLLRCSNHHMKKANKSDLKQQTWCSDRSALSRTPSNLSGYSATSTTGFPYSTRNRVDMQWLLNRHPQATREPCKKRELCFSINLLLGKPRAVMGLGYLKTQYFWKLSTVSYHSAFKSLEVALKSKHWLCCSNPGSSRNQISIGLVFFWEQLSGAC